MYIKKIFNDLFDIPDRFNDFFNYRAVSLKGRKIVIFGTGAFASVISSMIPCDVAYYLDNDPEKWGKTFYGKKIHKPDILKDENRDNLMILIASIYYFEISSQLERDYQLEESRHFECIEDLYKELKDFHLVGQIAFYLFVFVLCPVFLIALTGATSRKQG